MGRLKNRLAALEALAHKIKHFLPVRHFIENDTPEQAAVLAELDRAGIKVRLFRVVE